MKNTTIQNIAFFDAEFTAKTAQDRGVQEMIQCAFLIYQAEISDERKLVRMSDEPIYIYSTFVKPTYNAHLSDYIKELTGIRQVDVDEGKIFKNVLNDLYTVIKEYKIGRILTWGPDQMMLRHNCDVLDCDQWKSKQIRKLFKDVSAELSDFFGYNITISQHKTCQLLGIDETGARHDAYCDAVNLSKIIKEFCGQISL